MSNTPLTGYPSIDKPWLKTLPPFQYDESYAKRTAYDMIKNASGNTPDRVALKFYGTTITNEELFQKIDEAAISFYNLGVKSGDIVFMFCLNTPEMVYAFYGLNKLGAITEWFNPQGITPGMIHNLILESGTKTTVTIDILYDIIKKAVVDTPIEHIIVNSVCDSFGRSMKLKYNTQVYGISKLINSKLYKKLQNRGVPLANQISEYCEKEKIRAKASYKRDFAKNTKYISWNDFIHRFSSPEVEIERQFDIDKTTIIVHTGGTTGPVKRVAMTDYVINSAPYQSTLLPLHLHIGDVACQIVPPIVAFAFESLHFSRYYNMETHLIATYDRFEFIDIIQKTRANMYFTVPSFVKMLLEDESVKEMDLSFIKFIGHGGESLSPEDDKAIDDVLHNQGSACRNQLGFGQNEEFRSFTTNFDIDGIEKDYGCCGWPLPGNEYIIVDNDTLEELPYGKGADGQPYIGELWVSGPTTMKGYIGSAALENDHTIVYRDGKKYIRTGDQAYIDAKGKLYYVTRTQRIIRTQRGKIFTNLLENLINNYDEVLECCVVAAPDPDNVKIASCHIVLKEHICEASKAQKKQIINEIVLRVEQDVTDFYEYYIPGYYEFRKERLPRTSSMNKIDFKKLEEENVTRYKENGDRPYQRVRINL